MKIFYESEKAEKKVQGDEEWCVSIYICVKGGERRKIKCAKTNNGKENA